MASHQINPLQWMPTWNFLHRKKSSCVEPHPYDIFPHHRLSIGLGEFRFKCAVNNMRLNDTTCDNPA
ncbi:hypothetical protein VNO80_15634 [Phaseolus coccineus]|uniref:Uncharacterized protein n=1 Tax=Phaseolus coccineus TaxID=3886 RepID=A0AAN9MP28_PHACN